MEQLPILPLVQLVVYPHVVLPLALTDPNAVQLIDEVVRGNKRLLLGVVKPIGGTEPAEGAVMQARPDELYEVGTLGSVVRMLKLGDGSVRVMVQGLERARLVGSAPAHTGSWRATPRSPPSSPRTRAPRRSSARCTPSSPASSTSRPTWAKSCTRCSPGSQTPASSPTSSPPTSIWPSPPRRSCSRSTR